MLDWSGRCQFGFGSIVMRKMDKKQPDDPANLTVRILEQIRDEIRHVKDEVRHVKDEVRHVKDEVRDLKATTDERFERLEARQSADAIRLATEIVTVAKAVGQVRDLLKDRRAERTTLNDHEKRLRVIERKIA